MVFLTVLIALVPFATSGSRGFLIDELISATQKGYFTSRLSFAVLFLLLSSFIPSLLYTLQRYIGKIFWFESQTKLEMSILAKRGALDVATYEDPKQNNLLTRVQENGEWRMQNFIERQFFIIQDFIQVLTAIVILGSFAWWIVVIMLVGVAPELYIEIKYGKDTWSLYDDKAETRRKYWHLRSYFSDLNGIIELRLFQNIKNFTKKIFQLFSSFQTEQRKLERKRLILRLLSLLVLQGTGLFVIIWSVYQVLQGQLLVGVFTFFLASLGDFRGGLSSMFSNLARQYEDSLFVTDIFTFLALPAVLTKPTSPVKLKTTDSLDIKFENVSFAYPGTQRLVLKNFNLHIPAGRKIALVGINGSGKTTLVKLLCRFYDPTEGRILINGIDLKNLDIEQWYSELGVLFQEYAKYNFPVKETIALGNSQAKLSLDKVKAAAKLSEADKFIQDWPLGFEQMLGREFTDGLEPSIGQWQKLALARVFYRNPKVLILDEPTASIDAEAEAKIFERLENVATGKTLIMISHRFSTVRKANQIIVISEGQLEEQGSHEELMSKKGLYARLFALQAKGYE